MPSKYVRVGLSSLSFVMANYTPGPMGRLGSHPHIVTVFDLGQEADQPYMVTELMGELRNE